MPTFGSRKNNDRAGGGGRQMYLKTFKDGETQIAPLNDNPEKGWVKYLEHYDHGLKLSYPCARWEEDDNPDVECVGCDYPVEHEEYSDLDTHFPESMGSYGERLQERKKVDPGWGVRDRAPKWVLPAIDPKGFISLYKIGTGIRQDFIDQYSVLKTITANEWTIKRSGAGFGTSYALVAMPGTPRKPKAGIPIPDEPEISVVLGAKYTEALEKYGRDPMAYADAGGPDPSPAAAAAQAQTEAVQQAVADAPKTGDLASDVLAGHRAVAEAKGKTPTEPAQEPATRGFVPREASTGEIKDWLDNPPTGEPVAYDKRAARGVLVALAEKTMTERDIPPY